MAKDKYRRVTLNTLTPDKLDDLEFSIECACSCSDESSVGLSSCEIEVDYDEDTLEIESSDKFTEEELRAYLITKIRNGEFDERVYEIMICAWNDYVIDQAEYARESKREEEMIKTL